MDDEARNESHAGAPHGMTLAEAHGTLERQGFDAQLSVRDGAVVFCNTCHQEVSASELVVAEIVRVEGESDPEEMVAIVAATCPRCEARGTLTLMYGPLAPAEDSDVLDALAEPTQSSAELVE